MLPEVDRVETKWFHEGFYSITNGQQYYVFETLKEAAEFINVPYTHLKEARKKRNSNRPYKGWTIVFYDTTLGHDTSAFSGRNRERRKSQSPRTDNLVSVKLTNVYTGEVLQFKSLGSAARSIGVSRSGVKLAAKKKSQLAGQYLVEFLNEEQKN
jgi:hypothetical protein